MQWESNGIQRHYSLGNNHEICPSSGLLPPEQWPRPQRDMYGCAVGCLLTWPLGWSAPEPWCKRSRSARSSSVRYVVAGHIVLNKSQGRTVVAGGQRPPHQRLQRAVTSMSRGPGRGPPTLGRPVSLSVAKRGPRPPEGPAPPSASVHARSPGNAPRYSVSREQAVNHQAAEAHKTAAAMAGGAPRPPVTPLRVEQVRQPHPLSPSAAYLATDLSQMPQHWDPLQTGGRAHSRTDFVPKPRMQVRTQLDLMKQQEDSKRLQEREAAAGGVGFPPAEFAPSITDQTGPVSTPQLRYLLRQGAISRQQLHGMVQRGQVTPRQVQLALHNPQALPSGYRAPVHPAGACAPAPLPTSTLMVYTARRGPGGQQQQEECVVL